MNPLCVHGSAYHKGQLITSFPTTQHYIPLHCGCLNYRIIKLCYRGTAGQQIGSDENQNGHFMHHYSRLMKCKLLRFQCIRQYCTVCISQMCAADNMLHMEQLETSLFREVDQNNFHCFFPVFDFLLNFIIVIFQHSILPFLIIRGWTCGEGGGLKFHNVYNRIINTQGFLNM